MIADAPAASAPVTVAAVTAALVQRLHLRGLSFRYVLCFPDRHRYAGLPVVRCRVNFGEPHLVQYCSTILGGALVTDHERRAILCGAHPDQTLTGVDPRSFTR